MINFTYTRPETIQAALTELSAEPGSRPLAGGTNLVDLLKRGVERPAKLIDLGALPLRAIEMEDSVIRIGAMATNSEVAEHLIVRSHVPVLGMALHAGASPQIRNMATVGGNMLQRTRCSYLYDSSMPCNKRNPGSGCSAIKGYNRMHAIFTDSESCIAVHPSDMCVALAILDTTVVVRGAKGERRIPFQELLRLPGDSPEKDHNLSPGEMITGIEIIKPRYGRQFHYLKLRDRASFSFAVVSVAAGLELKNNTIVDARLAMGGVAHKPWRLKEAESYLRGKITTRDIFWEAGRRAMAGARGFGYNDFKQKLGLETIIETLKQAATL